MATIKVASTKSLGASLAYGQGKDKLNEQTKDLLRQNQVPEQEISQLHDRAVVQSGVNVDIANAKTEMSLTYQTFAQRGSVQGKIVIQSFSQEDLDFRDPQAWQEANHMGVELAQSAFPDHQVAIYTHIDGDSHMVHNHLVANIINNKTGHKENLRQYRPMLMQKANEISQAHGLSIIDHEKTQQREINNKAILKMREQGKYVWKDDLRSRIDSAMQNRSVRSYQDFSAHLNRSGVNVRERGKNITYAFTDRDNKQRRARGTALGPDYQKEVINHELERRTQTQNQTQQREQDFRRTQTAARSTISDRDRTVRDATFQRVPRRTEQITDRERETANTSHTVAQRQQRTQTTKPAVTNTIGRFQQLKTGVERVKKRAQQLQQKITERVHYQAQHLEQIHPNLGKVLAQVKKVTQDQEKDRAHEQALQRQRNQQRAREKAQEEDIMPW